MSTVLQDIVDRARRTPRRIVLPEATDARILRAAARLAREGIAQPILLGPPAEVHRAALAAGVELDGVAVEDPLCGPNRAAAFEAAEQALAGHDLGSDAIASLLDDPLYYAAALVRAGSAHGSLAGAIHPTAATLRAALRIIRPCRGARVVSSFFLMELTRPAPGGDDVLAFADCGLVPAPDLEQLVDIGLRTAHSFRHLVGREPRVAFLSFSTHGSAEHESALRMRRAAADLASRAPGFAVDGELQADAALSPEVGRTKAPGSPVAGRANVLIFPDLAAGNIAYKLVERLAGAQAIGPILQGLSRPANDLSRGCSEDDIVVAAAVTSLQSLETL